MIGTSRRKRLARAARSAAVMAVLVAAGTAAATAREPAAVDAEKLSAAREVLQVTGSAKRLEKIVSHLSEQLRQVLVRQKPENAAEIKEAVSLIGKRFEARTGELVERIAEVYAGRLSLADMQEITRFYKSPAGARFAIILPELTKEAWQAGQGWSVTIGHDLEAAVRLELKKRGVAL